MRSMTSRFLAGVAVLALGVAGAQGQEAKKKGGPNVDRKSAETSPEVQAVDTMLAADTLARHALARRDPLTLIAAAKVKKELGAQALKAKGDAETPDKPDARAPDALLARARELAKDRKDLLALADDVAKAGARGAVDGPKERYTVVRSMRTATFEIPFEGGRPAAVAITGDAASRLDLYVFDENKRPICAQEGPGDQAACRWTPIRTAVFFIQVKNYGIANAYRIWTN